MAMNNVTKKFDKARDKLGLDGDEQVLAGCLTDPKAAIGMAAGGVAGVAVQSALRARKEAGAPPAQGAAATWPAGRNLMAITSKRVVVAKMSQMSGRPTEVLAWWPHSDIVRFTVEKRATGYPFEVTFADGSIARDEGGKGTGADRLGEVAASIWR
ncbi:hypothetical protein PO878_09550 [Iamia majanohamensis]|uniref:Uncharacterized protein n=1 Tax=Iamia majanohamensis TaxID=467976 RepID=A0AAE9YD31_9ACTN|nr:hypothetical protein [Iamia majanohamensis]WCO68968.1 hypothetical protein PO878_09550 [Iamia majanohamensis]